MTTEEEKFKQEILKRLEELQEKLGPYTQYYSACRRFKFWSMTMIVIMLGQLGAIIYDTTLPAYQSLFLPWFACWALAYMGSWIPRRELTAMSRKVTAMRVQAHDDYYKVLTGVERPAAK